MWHTRGNVLLEDGELIATRAMNLDEWAFHVLATDRGWQDYGDAVEDLQKAIGMWLDFGDLLIFVTVDHTTEAWVRTGLGPIVIKRQSPVRTHGAAEVEF